MGMCKCCLYKVNRGRPTPGGHFLSDRSQTYVTMAGTTRIMSDKNSHHLQPMIMRSNRNHGNNRRHDDRKEQQHCSFWKRLKEMFTFKKDNSKSRQTNRLNGNACREKSGSYSSSPNATVLVNELRDEMELTGMMSSDLVEEEPRVAINESGTF